MWQSVVVAATVLWCGLYAAWTLCPKALRRAVAQRLLVVPHPQALHAYLVAAARTQGGCACDGCDRSALPPSGAGPAGYQPVVFQARAVKRPFKADSPDTAK